MAERSDAFPADFLWGAATSAYQIEGSPLADGAGPSNWHRFSHTPGWTEGGATGDIACDHYRRAAEDVSLMADLGLMAYRFSLAWGRILPEGRGAVNRRGLDFYSRLIDLLLERGIQPMVTLFHWDLPAALDDRGGWLNPEIATWFAEYARVVFEAFGDRVSLWTTLNEPWVVVDAGYLHGVHAPGHRNLFEAPIAAHNLLRAHGAAVEVFRSTFGANSKQKIGLVVNLEPKDPASDAPEDIDAAARADVYMNRHYLDPVFFGRYPQGLAELYGEAWPTELASAAEMSSIAQPLDFLGLNYYTRSVVRDDPGVLLTRAGRVIQEGALHTEMPWEVHPESLTRVLLWVRGRYGEIPLYITENGAAFADIAVDGQVEDPLRIAYLRSHLNAARAAMARGVDLRGYFVWSLLDNLEWSCGFTKRMGIVRVDFDSQKRTPKASAEFYREVIRTNGGALNTPE